MHDAFQVTTVVDKVNRIESIFAHGDRLLIGTGLGHLLEYDIKEPLVADENEVPEVTLINTHKNFSKRPIEQLDIIKEIDVLVSLSDGLISLHDLRTFELRMTLGKTKGANLFTIQTMVEMNQEQIPQLVTRLAVAVRKKLVVFVWKDTEFLETKEWPISDRVKTMAWVGSTKICLGLASEYALMEVESGQWTELFGPMTEGGLLNGANIGGSNGNGGSGGGSGSGSGSGSNSISSGAASGAISTLNSLYNMSIGFRGGKPMVTKIPNNEMLLARDHVSIFLGLDGTPTRKVGIEWSGTPEQMGYSYPYVIAILPKHVEVRNIQSLALVQQIDISNAKFLNQGKLVYVATGSQIWRLTPYSFSSQIDQLVEKHAYEEAVSLLEQIDAVLVENKEEKLRMIRMARAHDLFLHGEYDTALELFQELDTPAEDVIELYPSMISGQLAKDKENRQDDDDNDSLLALTTSRKNGNNDDHQHEQLRPDSRTSNYSKTNTVLSNNSSSKLSGIIQSYHAHQQKELVPLTGIHLHEAITYLIRFLTDKRQRLSKQLAALHGNGILCPPTSGSTTLSSSSVTSGTTLQHLTEQATLVDTTLLKSYMLTNDALVGPLLRVQNHCDVKECETILMDKKKYKELVDLYNCKGLHSNALDLLSKLGQQTDGPLRGVLPTIRYLQRLGLDHFDLVLQYSRWVLESDPIHGMDIFIDDLAEVESFPRDRVLHHLASISDNLTIQYLEYIMDDLHDQTPDFHNRLAIAYLDKIKADQVSEDEKTRIRTKLLQFLADSTHYRAEKILSRLPLDDLYEERAVLLSRIGQHDQALDIYVYKLKNYAMAEEYCTKIYRENAEKGSKMYLTLLRVYLQPSSSSFGTKGKNNKSTKRQPLLAPALELLAHHGSHVNAAEVLSILPLNTPLQGLFPFFEKYIRESNRNRNKDHVVKNLLKAEQFQVEEQLSFYRSRAVKITEDRMCPQCNKRIGNSVFAVFPNGAVVHYSCKEKIEQTQWKLV
ncbi:vacuolar sorting protein 39 domain 2-domain-containing protein [Halteromyces radiatus]|uniref:vacuolar sorting protein 39 domain 2-domain-containing protein n=1 Tax=Halteromyces radiatus TaxID=101107 RepID=UPI00222099F1|nr:vacuolar sorting protein 39 domain 2-domain-containing protein [Halteromyces radiatus]KAI8096965.1 vacuolar sorting protein 39 domain 2-domain-containing protein [Halteromyces radiatus]